MRKLIILISIIGILVVANVLFNNKDFSSEKSTKTLAEAILLEEPLTSIEISKNNDQITLVKKGPDSCYEIVNLDYCVDNKKFQLLKKFIGNEIKDIYEKTEENLQRLGFKKNKNSSSIIINNKKSLYFGNINKYNEVYVLQANNIYKIEYSKGMLETTSRFWLDKSNPLLPLAETDEFDIEIYNFTIDEANKCEVKHKEIILTTKYLTLRNSFFDLYASDAKKFDSFEDSQKRLLVSLKSPNSGKKIFDFFLWKEEHLTYFLESAPKQQGLKFLIPNSVYENVKSYCK